MLPTKHRLSRIEKALLNDACAKHREQGHPIHALILPGDYKPIQICVELYLPDMVLLVMRAAWTKFRLAMCVESNNVPLLVIDQRGSENLFMRSKEGPLTADELRESFPHLDLTDDEWTHLTDYLL